MAKIRIVYIADPVLAGALKRLEKNLEDQEAFQAAIRRVDEGGETVARRRRSTTASFSTPDSILRADALLEGSGQILGGVGRVKGTTGPAPPCATGRTGWKTSTGRADRMPIVSGRAEVYEAK